MNNTVHINRSAPSQTQIEQAVITAISRTLRLPEEQVRPDSLLHEHLGLDSMGLIHINVSVEEQLHAALDIAEAPEDELRTVRDLVELISARIGPANQEALQC
jgi:acyl carrier protein